ncbi:unnamed protein product [Parnassius apollo]|uniref:(apollo) hypothetical protein n=1 Tax=Parnassius apollo TaxID=110799 RepID=A0A8S3WKZ6_PARAO|nr:unnamed protein product [Parnassius apollo]
MRQDLEDSISYCFDLQQIQSKLRNKPTIIAKEEYIEIFKELGQLYSLEQDWELKDTKDLKKFYKDLKNKQYEKDFLQSQRG